VGPWIAPTHQRWQWYHDISQDVVYHTQSPDQWVKYSPIPGPRVTRRSRTHYSSPLLCSPPDSLQVLYPTTVVPSSNGTIRSLPGISHLCTSAPSAVSTLWHPDQVPPRTIQYTALLPAPYWPHSSYSNSMLRDCWYFKGGNWTTGLQRWLLCWGRWTLLPWMAVCQWNSTGYSWR